MSKISELKVLDFQGNHISEEAGEYFASMLSKNQKLEQLLLSNNNLGKGVVYIIRSLQELNSLRVLNICNNNMPNEIYNELAYTLSCNQFLNTTIIW